MIIPYLFNKILEEPISGFKKNYLLKAQRNHKEESSIGVAIFPF